jgi:putative acetyltransferase
MMDVTGGRVDSFVIRPIQPEDDPAVAAIIHAVMPEFGADGPGFAIHDPEVAAMHAAYDRPGAAYFVVESAGRILGGAGLAPLDGGPERVCELRKMYYLPELRGQGAGAAMLRKCLATAAALGYGSCYLETLTGMDAAQRLYLKLGFKPLQAPLGATGHHGCNRWFLKTPLP